MSLAKRLVCGSSSGRQLEGIFTFSKKLIQAFLGGQQVFAFLLPDFGESHS